MTWNGFSTSSSFSWWRTRSTFLSVLRRPLLLSPPKWLTLRCETFLRVVDSDLEKVSIYIQYIQRNLLEILLNQIEIRLNFPISVWFNKISLCKINRSFFIKFKWIKQNIKNWLMFPFWYNYYFNNMIVDIFYDVWPLSNISFLFHC